jgi:hypothetical protein
MKRKQHPAPRNAWVAVPGAYGPAEYLERIGHSVADVRAAWSKQHQAKKRNRICLDCRHYYYSDGAGLSYCMHQKKRHAFIIGHTQACEYFTPNATDQRPGASPGPLRPLVGRQSEDA